MPRQVSRHRDKLGEFRRTPNQAGWAPNLSFYKVQNYLEKFLM